MTAPGAPVLELRDVSAAYGPFRALFGVDLRVAPGEAVALLGPNGAGKTTVARVATGLVRPSAGSVLVAGEDWTGRAPYEFARAGIAHAPEGRSVLGSLTVEENLLLALRRDRSRRVAAAAMTAALEPFPVLAARRRQVAGTLSGGEQRMLSMARVLATAPRLLVADELSLGLSPKAVADLYEALARVRSAGTALLVVEQHISHALALSDRVVLLAHGTVAWEGPAAEALAHTHTPA